MPKYGVISGPYFPVFGLNTEIYSVNLLIESEYRKIRTRNNSIFGHFLHIVKQNYLLFNWALIKFSREMTIKHHRFKLIVAKKEVNA